MFKAKGGLNRISVPSYRSPYTSAKGSRDEPLCEFFFYVSTNEFHLTDRFSFVSFCKRHTFLKCHIFSSIHSQYFLVSNDCLLTLTIRECGALLTSMSSDSRVSSLVNCKGEVSPSQSFTKNVSDHRLDL